MSAVVVKPPNLSPFQGRVYKHIRDYLNNREGKSRGLVIAGRRVGKTYSIIRAVTPFVFGGSFNAAYGAAGEKTDAGGWRDISDFCGEFLRMYPRGDYRFSPVDEGYIQFPNGGKWDRFNFKSENPGRSLACDFAHADEVQLMTRGPIDALTPVLLTRRGMLVMSGTAPKTVTEWRNSEWWIKIVNASPREREAKYKSYFVEYKRTEAKDIAWVLREADRSAGRQERDLSYYMPIAERELDTLKETVTLETYKREILMDLSEPDTGSVFRHWGNVSIGDYKYDPNLGGTVFLGIDRGFSGAMDAVLLIQKYIAEHAGSDGTTKRVKRYRVCGEYASSDMISSLRVAEIAVGMTPKNSFSPMYYPDVRAVELRFEMERLGLPVYAANVGIIDGNDYLSTLMANGVLEIDSSCTVLIQQARDYVTNSSGVPSDKNIDTIDALRYAIYNDAMTSGDYQAMRERVMGAVQTSVSGPVGTFRLNGI